VKERAPRSNEAPKVFGDIVDFACRLDRTFFRDNPSSRSYVRRYVPGEFWPHDSHVDRALVEYVEHVERARLFIGVTALESGLRTRRPHFDIEALNALGATRSRLR
jgi:hypothetical protein